MIVLIETGRIILRDRLGESSSIILGKLRVRYSTSRGIRTVLGGEVSLWNS